jgi:hypothetical protein
VHKKKKLLGASFPKNEKSSLPGTGIPSEDTPPGPKTFSATLIVFSVSFYEFSNGSPVESSP